VYHTLVNLQVIAYKAIGALMERSKRFDEAIEAYKEGKRIIEANYGQNHQLFNDMTSCINQAKFRSKFIKKPKPQALDVLRKSSN
jgi:hypothetical protein